MYSGSTEFNNLIEKSGGNALITRFKFSNFSIEKFTKLEYYGGSNSSDDIAIGTTNMAYLDVSTITDKIITNQEFLFEVGMKLSDGTVEYAPIGYFKVQNPDENEDTVDFKAYDRMQKFEKPYVSSLAYPTDSEKVLNELCTICGVELATPIASPITIVDKLEGYTCREVLGYIAGIHGFFACFDRYGKLNLRWYSKTPIEKRIGLIWSLTKSQSNYTVEKITLAKDTETTYTSGTGISGINHSNPYATQAIADNIYASLGGFSYRPCEISMLDDIRLDPWDMLKVTYLDGSVLTIPVMALEHSFTSGETRVKSFGKTNTENEYGYAGPVTQAMDRMTTELLVANRIIATKVDAEWVKANTLSADSAVIVDLKTNVAKIDTLIFGSASGTTIQTEFSNAVIAQLGEAQIKSAMIESVSASKIMAGEIYTNLVKIYGDSNKRLVIADNTIQLSDDSDVVRMQVGEDSFGQYNIIIRNSDEEVIFDAVGVTEKGYHNGSIKNIAVADNANIGAEKLNIDSLFNVINNDGSHTLKSSKIYLDSEAQTLDVSFKTMQTNVSALSTDVSTQGTQLAAVQGQISSKIWQQDITTAVNELQIGGRNLIRYNYIVEFASKYIDKSDFVSKGKVVCSGDNINTGFRFDSASYYDASTIYTLSGYLTVTSQSCENVYLYNGKNLSFISFSIDGIDYGSPLDNIVTGANAILNDGKKHYFELKFKTPANIPADEGVSFTFIQLNKNSSTSITYEFEFLKLEKGNKATDWSPAPEDVNDDILALTTQYSTLEQTLSGFKLEVGATYATKESLNSYATTASLDLYIKKDPTSGELKSAIEAIADTINITARGGLNLSGNRFTLTSTNTTITADGRVTFKAGTIGNWNIEQNKLSSTAQVYIPPDINVLNTIADAMRAGTTSSLSKNLYDFNSDGAIDLFDFVKAKRFYLGLDTYNNTTSAIAQPSNVTANIDPTNLEKIINISGTDMWGTKRETYIGINGLKTDSVKSRDAYLSYMTIDGGNSNYSTDSDYALNAQSIKSNEIYANELKVASSVLMMCPTSNIQIYNNPRDMYGNPVLCMDNPISFTWSDGILRIYVDNTIVASWIWGEQRWE